MTPSQTKMVERMKKFVIEHGHGNVEFKSKPKVDDQNYAVWLSCYIGNVGDEGTALMSCRDHWFLKIGKRGKVEAKGAPKSLHQFAGRTWLGVHIAKDVY